MAEHQPDNQKVADLIAYLVEAGYLHDSQSRQAARTYRQCDWLKQWDAFQPAEGFLNQVVNAMCASFTTTAELERFLIGSFSNDYARQVAHNLVRDNSVRANVDNAVRQFARVGWLTALVTAAQDAWRDNIELGFLVLYMRDANRQALESRQPKPSAPAVAGNSAMPAPVTQPPAPKLPTVTAVCKKLGKTEQNELVELIVSAFDAQGLAEIAAYDLGERLDNITPSDALRPMAGRLVQWCLDQEGSVVDLLNAIIKRRQRRSDVPVFITKLVDTGYITVA